MPEFAIHFGREHGEASSYKLLELPKELVELVKNGTQNQISIRGRDDDDAVLCTKDRTYNLRAVAVSNAFCILTPPRLDEDGNIVLRETASQILELTPTIPKLHRLRGLLRDSEYNDDIGQDYERHTLASIKSAIQASDVEFDAALKSHHVLILNNELRPMNLGYLNTVLELILNTLVVLSVPPGAAPAVDVAETLQSDHDISSEITLQVMSWFGDVSGDNGRKIWSMNEQEVVRQLGIGILSGHRNDAVEHLEFLKKWKSAAGDSFQETVDLALLQGEYLAIQHSGDLDHSLVYFPSSELPATASERFAELFLVQAKWKKDEIMPFLTEIAFDEKEKEKLLMKFTRGTKDKAGIMWYTTRGGTTPERGKKAATEGLAQTD